MIIIIIIIIIIATDVLPLNCPYHTPRSVKNRTVGRDAERANNNKIAVIVGTIIIIIIHVDKKGIIKACDHGGCCFLNISYRRPIDIKTIFKDAQIAAARHASRGRVVYGGGSRRTCYAYTW